MNFNILKMGFQAYLQEKLGNENKELAVANSDISIFMYAEEFKEYVSQQISTDQDISSMSISDILEMEIVNGKLMTDEEAAEAEKALEGEDYEESEIDDSTEAEIPAVTEESAEQAPTQNINGEVATEQQLLFQGIMNDLLASEEVKNVINTDSIEEISEDEVKAFLEAIGAQDGDETNITLDEIFSAISGIKDNTFKINSEETPEAETVNETAQDTSVQETTQTTNSGSSSGGGSNFSYSQSTTPTTSKKSVSNMSLDELKSELTTTQTDITEQEKTLNDALSGTSETLVDLQGKIDETYAAYKEALGSELAEQLEDIETRLTEKEKAVAENDQAIWEQENTIADCETAYENAQATTATIEGQIGVLESQLSGLDNSEENASVRAEIEGKIANLKQQKTDAEKAEEAALDKLNDAKEVLEGENGLLKQKEKLEEELEAIQLEKTEFEQKLPEEDATLQEAKTNYETAKQEFKTQQEKEVSAAREAIATNKDYVNEINTAITVKENEQLVKDNTVRTAGTYDEEEGERLIETARQMLERYGSSSGYCATGVSRTMSMAYGISMGGNGCDWDTNMDKLVEQGMFAEVTSDYPSSNDLSNLPAGAVICWEATGGTNGGGAQYGHVAIADGNGGEISDHYQQNIYKSVGGRSDTYRIFIPVS